MWYLLISRRNFCLFFPCAGKNYGTFTFKNFKWSVSPPDLDVSLTARFESITIVNFFTEQVFWSWLDVNPRWPTKNKEVQNKEKEKEKKEKRKKNATKFSDFFPPRNSKENNLGGIFSQDFFWGISNQNFWKKKKGNFRTKILEGEIG